MDADAFARELAAAAPTLAALKKAGIKGKLATEMVGSYRCEKRPTPLTEPAGSDALLELLRGWDLSRIEVGMVRFTGTHADPSGAIHVGVVEADPLVTLPTGEIVVHELGANGHVLWRAAESGSAFLDALVRAARFLAQRTIEAIDFEDFEAARAAATECATAAGGKAYQNFYVMLLGAEG